MHVIPGPPYFFRCRRCGELHQRKSRLSLRCPHCGSFKVRPSSLPLK